MTAADDLTADILKALARSIPGARKVTGLRRLTGGASRETWAFDLQADEGTLPLILRRAPAGTAENPVSTGIPLSAEARLIEAARAGGVPTPRVRHVLEGRDGLGEGYVMSRVPGETIPRRILRDDAFANVRPRLARQCGEILARIHAVPRAAVEGDLDVLDARAQLARYREIHESFGEPHPVFEAAFAWLAQRAGDAPQTFVHGDFRHGNLLIGPEGVTAVLDWELAHIGDPLEDLGWICVPSWRFGQLDRPVGGFGAREELISGYEAAGGAPVDRERMKFWEVFGSLKWGVMCQMMGHAHLSGMVRSLERAAIGRRVSETELDLVLMLRGEMP
ncbi:MAG: phosphotransferase family protein [Alphaproteobacteria bacterium]